MNKFLKDEVFDLQNTNLEIQSNNKIDRWTFIKSEIDLPKKDSYYWVVNKEGIKFIAHYTVGITDPKDGWLKYVKYIEIVEPEL